MKQTFTLFIASLFAFAALASTTTVENIPQKDCASCHGEQLAKSHGRLGFVDNGIMWFQTKKEAYKLEYARRKLERATKDEDVEEVQAPVPEISIPEVALPEVEVPTPRDIDVVLKKTDTDQAVVTF